MMGSKLAVALLLGFLCWCYQSIKPPPSKLCGSADGPPITSSRIRLRDGRHLSYKESGIRRERASYKIVVAHGFGSSKEFTIPASREMVEEMGICFVSFDRAGYGESDPNPSRSVTSEAVDIEQLANELGLGKRFYVIGVSMGGYSAWACLNHLPHRLAGVALIVPVVNYWWPSFRSSLSMEAFKRQLVPDQWMYRFARHAPSYLLYWWMTQKWFPSSCIAAGDPNTLSPQDKVILRQAQHFFDRKLIREKAIQQGEFESLHRDLMVAFSTWEFDPMQLRNPYPENESNVHIWQGYEDRIVPCGLQRFVSQKLPWIKYHEVPDGGHMILLAQHMSDRIIRSLLLGDDEAISTS